VLAALVATLRRVPVVLTAHGQDVRNVGARAGVRAATAWACGRASAVICVSDHLRRELERAIPAVAGLTEVIDCGVDLERFAPQAPEPARRELGWEGDGPRLLFVGTLDERKNVRRLAEAFARLGRGSLALVGDGPLRSELEGRPGLHLAGRVPQAQVARWMAACDVLCLPSLTEPFGQVLLEAMAGERSVLATREGGPPEFVPPGAGVLVDPESVEAIATGMAEVLALPAPTPAARAAAAEHDVRRQGERIEALLARAVAGAGG